MCKAVFLDTNVFLHYQLFDQINWCEVLKASKVTIVVPPVTVRELNKHKELHPRPRVKNRAGLVLKKFSVLFESAPRAYLRDDVEIQLEDRDPMIDFPAFQLRHDIQDDRLIASIIMFQNENEDPQTEVVLVTSDAGLTIMAKVRRQGIATIKLPDTMKLPEEPDPQQKRIRELEQEMRELKRRVPVLSLAFDNGSQHAIFALPRPLELKQDDLENRLQEIKRRYPKMEVQFQQTRESSQHPASIAETLASLGALVHVLPEDRKKYGATLDRFYQMYADYLSNSVRYGNLKRRTIKLTMFVVNDGSAPAEDIDVFIHFPNGFKLMIGARDFPEPPRPPNPPAKPKTQVEKMLETVSVPLVSLPRLGPYVPDPILPPPNVSTPKIKSTSSYDVTFHVQRVKHKLQESAEPLYVVFDSFESACSFHVDYRILAANVPKEVVGQLHVVIQKE